MSISQLNEDYSIEDQLKFIAGNNNLPLILISNKKANAMISLYGGQVLSFKPQGEEEDLLFLSKKADYNGKKAIRGGIPICWPWFGAGHKDSQQPNHGFARNSLWTVLETKVNADFETQVILQLQQNTEHQKIWPHAFELTLKITVGETLTLELLTHNTGEERFFMSQTLHTYFQVGDVQQVQVLGLENKRYLDKLDNRQKTQTTAVTVSEEVDRIYSDVEKQLIIDDPVLNRRIQINSEGSKTAVVWNPWIKKSDQISDLEADDYKDFLCVETSNVAANQIELLPDEKHSILTNFKILPKESRLLVAHET